MTPDVILKLALDTRYCLICGALTYLKMTSPSDGSSWDGVPFDTQEIHRSWHERTGA